MYPMRLPIIVSSEAPSVHVILLVAHTATRLIAMGLVAKVRALPILDSTQPDAGARKCVTLEGLATTTLVATVVAQAGFAAVRRVS